MKKTLLLALLFASLALIIPAGTKAVSFSPVPGENEEKASKGIREKGEAVCLFQSGTADVRKAIGIGDVLAVYRQEKGGPLREVGRIKVLSFVGEDYLRGEVMEGELQTGDVAKKGDVASLVISSGERCP